MDPLWFRILKQVKKTIGMEPEVLAEVQLAVIRQSLRFAELPAAFAASA